MAPARVLFAALCLLTALPLQVAVFARLPLPGGGPNLVLVVVVAFAVASGPGAGLGTGFAGGLLADLLSDHALGLLALVFGLVGYGAGLARQEAERSTLAPLLTVAAAAAAATTGYAALAAVIGDPRVSWAALAIGLPASVLYDVVLAPFVVPVVGALSRRLEPDTRRG